MVRNISFKRALLAGGFLLASAGMSLADYNTGTAAFNAGDYTRAFQEYRQSAHAGNPLAQYMMGRLYAEGRGVGEDKPTAYMWFDLSASNGNSRAITARDAIAAEMDADEIERAQEMAADWRANRPAIATPIPVPGSTPTVLLDAGANAEVQAAWLVQFAQMGTAYCRARYGVAEPRVGLLNIGEEGSKGTDLTKEAHGLLRAASGIRFVGNVEGRDLLTDEVDVVVTDGFTGNVALKTLEGGMKFLRDAVFAAMMSSDEAIKASETLLPLLLPLAEDLDPDSHGGAMALGLQGVCIISHGSSSAKAIVNAVRVAKDMVESGLVAKVQEAVTGT